MKKFVMKSFVLLAICSLLIVGYCQLATVAITKYKGLNTADQINMSFLNAVKKDYNCYFLGNSRIYRDINPDIFNSVNSYNFAHDNDSYNQMYYKLLFLLEKGKPIECLIIGTDYFQFSFLSDTRNYIYSRLFPKDYSDDFGEKEKSWFEIEEENYMRMWSNKQNALYSCIKYILHKAPPMIVNYQKENGQYIDNGNASIDETVNRDYTVLDVQYEYFKKIISLCEDKNIELFVLMPPLWEGETATHTDKEREQFNIMIRKELEDTPYRNNYINYSEEKGLSSYLDFIDVTHLKPEVADDFSVFVNNRIFNHEK